MRYRKEIITTAGTLACALAIGFMMQKSQSAQSLYSADSNTQTGEPLINGDAAVLDVEEIILTSGELSTTITPAPTPEEAVNLAPAPATLIMTPDTGAPVQLDPKENAGDEDAAAFDNPACAIESEARAMAAAMVNLTLNAPCLPNEHVTVMHNGLLFNEVTDDAGAMDIVMPALDTEAVFVVAFSNGEGTVAQTLVEEFVNFDRVVVQWKGDAGFELHAREFGADYGTEGHVWSQAARDMSYAVTGAGGYLSRLGNPEAPDGLRAEVYTYPASGVQGNADIEISIEAEVAENNCGLEIEAKTLQTMRGAETATRSLTLSVPDCDAAGNFLVLNNLFEDMKVASN